MDALAILPYEMWDKILNMVPETMVMCGQVCSTWRTISKDVLWRHVTNNIKRYYRCLAYSPRFCMSYCVPIGITVLRKNTCSECAETSWDNLTRSFIMPALSEIDMDCTLTFMFYLQDGVYETNIKQLTFL